MAGNKHAARRKCETQENAGVLSASVLNGHQSGNAPFPRGNTATGWLKIVALVFMFIDHAGMVLFNNQHDMRVLGRIAFPVYAWCLIVGFHYTRDVKKYLLRLLILFAVSQPLYVYALGQDWLSPNICLTLFVGLAALWGIREKRYGSQIWAPAAAVCLATLLHLDGGWKGILLIILLYMAQDSRGGITAVMIAFFLFWGSSYQPTEALFGIPLNLTALPDFLSSPLSAFLRGETWALLSLPFILILWPKKDIRLPKWAGYIMYPAHLFLILILKLLFIPN